MSDRTQDLTNHRKVAITCKNYTDNKITELKWELGSHTLDVTTDSDTKYIKNVPSGAIGCQINSVGGMSYKSENLIVLTDETKTVSSVTFTIQNGKISSSGTPTNTGWIKIKEFTLNAGTYSYADLTTNTSKVYLVTSNYVQLATTFTLSETATVFIGKTGNDIINNGNVSNSMPMLVSGSTAPTTWSEGFSGIRDSAVTSVVSKDSNDTTVDTLAIPTEIQNLTGYGWGINNTCYNYIDFDRKVFVQKVGTRAYQSGDESDTSVITDGIMTYYQLSSVVETDISSYITKDTIDVEPLGTLEFTNTYSQDVPSDIDYLIEEVKA